MTTPSRSLRILIAAVIAAVAVAGPALAQSPGAGSSTQPSAPVDTATLVQGNRPIILFRSSIGAVSARERAASGRTRIADILRLKGGDSVTTRSIPEGMLVMIAGQPAFSIVAGDRDAAAGEAMPALVDATVSRLRAALATDRQERSLLHLFIAGGLVILATILFVVGLRLLKWSRHRLLGRLPVSVASFSGLRVSGFTVLSPDAGLLAVRRVIDLMAWAAGLFAGYLWLAFVLTRFSYSRPWGEALGGYLLTTISGIALRMLQSIPSLFTVVVIVVATRWIARVIAAFFDSVEAGSVELPWLHPETANATKRIAMALVWMFAIVVAYPYLPGSSSDVFKGVSVFAGIVLSLGSSSVMSQGMSGLVLMYARALKAGDYVRIGDIEGTVTTLGMLSTKIRTTKLEEVTIPNTVVVGTNIRNFSRLARPSGILLHTGVTIGYDVPWRQVEAMLLVAAGRTADLLKDPPPFVLKTELSDFYVAYQLNARLEQAERRIAVLSELHEHIVDAFNEHGVQILSPHYIDDPASPAVVPRDRWYAAPARPPRPET